MENYNEIHYLMTVGNFTCHVLSVLFGCCLVVKYFEKPFWFSCFRLLLIVQMVIGAMLCEFLDIYIYTENVKNSFRRRKSCNDAYLDNFLQKVFISTLVVVQMFSPYKATRCYNIKCCALYEY